MLATFARALESRAFRQSDAALALGVHQGQISKVLRGDFVRATGLPERLFEYANMRLAERAHADKQSAAEDTMMRDLVARLAVAWDRTPEGARALGEILDGVARLRRS
jgi:uncharacterized protein YcaQ